MVRNKDVMVACVQPPASPQKKIQRGGNFFWVEGAAVHRLVYNFMAAQLNWLSASLVYCGANIFKTHVSDVLRQMEPSKKLYLEISDPIWMEQLA